MNFRTRSKTPQNCELRYSLVSSGSSDKETGTVPIHNPADLPVITQCIKNPIWLMFMRMNVCLLLITITGIQHLPEIIVRPITNESIPL